MPTKPPFVMISPEHLDRELKASSHPEGIGELKNCIFIPLFNTAGGVPIDRLIKSEMDIGGGIGGRGFGTRMYCTIPATELPKLEEKFEVVKVTSLAAMNKELIRIAMDNQSLTQKEGGRET
jgi:hypothetical protein